MAKINDWKDLQSIATELGIKFKRTTNLNHKIDHRFCDPKVVYLIDPPGSTKATLFWAKTVRTFDWTTMTKAMMKKCLSDDSSDRPCGVCFEEVGHREAIGCTQCYFQICGTCFWKLCLNESTISRILNGERMATHHCPGCRKQVRFDVRGMYVQVVDRLCLFPEAQREALIYIKRHDPGFKDQMMEWLDRHPLRIFKPGTVVMLWGLKQKKSWNGKSAKITGEGVVGSANNFRWPVQLSDGSEGLLRQRVMTPKKTMNQKQRDLIFGSDHKSS